MWRRSVSNGENGVYYVAMAIAAVWRKRLMCTILSMCNNLNVSAYRQRPAVWRQPIKGVICNDVTHHVAWRSTGGGNEAYRIRKMWRK